MRFYNYLWVVAVDSDAWVEGSWECGGALLECNTEGLPSPASMHCGDEGRSGTGIAPCFGETHELWPSGLHLSCGMYDVCAYAEDGYHAPSSSCCMEGGCSDHMTLAPAATTVCRDFPRACLDELLEETARNSLSATVIQIYDSNARAFDCQQGICVSVPVTCVTGKGMRCWR